jgi:hypothetical protein
MSSFLQYFTGLGHLPLILTALFAIVFVKAD